MGLFRKKYKEIGTAPVISSANLQTPMPSVQENIPVISIPVLPEIESKERETLKKVAKHLLDMADNLIKTAKWITDQVE